MFACIHAPGLAPENRVLLLECAKQFSPRIEDSGADWILLDVRGLGSLIGGSSHIADAIAERAKAACIHVNVAVAAQPQTAVSAARGHQGVTVVPSGEESKTLEALSLDLLSPSPELRETLAVWGIRTFGELARLPESGVAERLGAEGLTLLRQARGQNQRPLIPALGTEEYSLNEELEHPLDVLEPLAFLLSRMLHDLCARLRSHGFATSRLDLMLRLENRSEFTRTLQLPFSGIDSNTFLKLLQLDLAAHPPGAPITAVRLTVHPVEPRRVQTGLFFPPEPEPEKLELTVARILSIVGEGNAGIPELLDTHRPDSFRMASTFGARPRNLPLRPKPPAPKLAMRRFRPPLPARVDAPFGAPQRIQARGITGKVCISGGPWRSSGDWWATGSWRRDEWDVALDSGGLYRLYREPSGGWFVEGNYD